MDGTGFKALIARSARPGESDTAQLQLALHEVECCRDAIRGAYVRVMLGKMRTLHDDSVPLPPDVQETIALVDSLERKMRSTRTFVLNRLPNFGNRLPGLGTAALPSYEAGGLKYLFSREREEDACFVISVPLEEYLSFEVDDTGRIAGVERTVIHARPFIHLPPRRIREMRRLNSALFEDKAGLGDLLPSFLALYTEFVAFAVEDRPAILGAHLLSRRFPTPARELLEDHAAKTMSIAGRVLDELGYHSLVDDGADARAGFAATGMTLFHVLKQWGNHCCKSLFLNDFAEQFSRTRVVKVGDVEHLISRPSLIPAPK
ncbi:MAG: hypothetical protein M0R80_16025 [Proteobacteria bacterium]|jgi:hypothetical protein|nr:hypothetical protein [Pseudomonadota bacterium]